MVKARPRGGCNEQLTRSKPELTGLSQVRFHATSWKCRIEPKPHAFRPQSGEDARLGHLNPIPRSPFCVAGRPRVALGNGPSGASSAMLVITVPGNSAAHEVAERTHRHRPASVNRPPAPLKTIFEVVRNRIGPCAFRPYQESRQPNP